jgi:uncharacterized protein
MLFPVAGIEVAPAQAIKWLLAFILVFTGGRYVIGFLF